MSAPAKKRAVQASERSDNGSDDQGENVEGMVNVDSHNIIIMTLTTLHST